MYSLEELEHGKKFLGRTGQRSLLFEYTRVDICHTNAFQYVHLQEAGWILLPQNTMEPVESLPTLQLLLMKKNLSPNWFGVCCFQRNRKIYCMEPRSSHPILRKPDALFSFSCFFPMICFEQAIKWLALIGPCACECYILLSLIASTFMELFVAKHKSW